jgi:RNA polymerase sigma factor (TIGR02999 family)
MSDVTLILQAIGRGEKEAADHLLPVVYGELRKLAAFRLSQEKPGQTLQPTALVHEAWLRVVHNGDPGWNSRGHFFSAAAEAMRRILVENARRKQAQKHGGDLERVVLDKVDLAGGSPDTDLLALNEALDELEAHYPNDAAVIKLRFFTGLTQKEVAEALGRSLTSVETSWAFSRAWLFSRLDGQTKKTKV